MSDQSLDIIAINETKLDQSISDAQLHIDNYTLLRKDRTRQGGGVAFYIRNTICYIERQDLSPVNLEMLCIEVQKANSKPFLLSTWYKPPDEISNDILGVFELFLAKVDAEGKESIILGDVNCDVRASQIAPFTSNLGFLCDSYQYSQLINDFTRITETTKTLSDNTKITKLTRTLIDHAYTNDHYMITNSGVIHVGISDHSLIYVVRKFPSFKTDTKFKEFRSFKHFGEESFIKELSKTDWNLFLQNSNDPNQLWSAWKCKFMEIIDRHAPIRRQKVRTKPVPWLTSRVKKLARDRDYLKSKAVRTDSISCWDEYKRARNRVNMEIRNAKRKFFQNSITESKGNTKAAWKVINRFLSRKTKSHCISNIKLSDGSSLNDPSDIANHLNSHFAGVGPRMAANINDNGVSPEYYMTPAKSIFHLKPTNVVNVLEIINKLSSNKATGLDGISSKIIKISASVIAPALTFIFNKAIETGIFPDDWKTARVTPLHKNASKCDSDNYRPISILPVISKVFERIIYDQFYFYLCSNGLISKFQSGFRALHSTTTALLFATDNWLVNMDKGLINGVLYLDLRKAFDSVDHQILLNKLELYGVQGNSLALFDSYLKGRSQMCVVNGTISSPQMISHGVPQGSILGPLLFLLFINDLPNCLKHSTPGLFADDTNVTVADRDIYVIENLLNEDLEQMSKWLTSNKLSLNLTKTEFMLIGSLKRLKEIDRNPDIRIADVSIQRVSHSKLVGVHIDEGLTWDQHVAHIIKKVLAALKAIRNVRDFVDIQTLIMIYKSLVEPYFVYCSAVWDSLGIGLAKRLQKLQNRAARIITRSDYTVRSADLLKELSWQTLSQKRISSKATMMYKILNGQAPEYLREKFSYVCQRHSHSLRNADVNLILPRPNTEYGKKCFSYSGAALWNCIPADVRKAQTLQTFKAGVTTCII